MTLPTLPVEEETKLISLHESGDRVALQRQIAALRTQGWPLRSIGDPLHVSRSTVQYWERIGQADFPLPPAPLSPKAIETAGNKIMRSRARVRPHEREKFKYLAISAQKVRSRTPADSQLRRDADLLDKLIAENLERTVAYSEIAKLMGVTHRAVKARMERRESND